MNSYIGVKEIWQANDRTLAIKWTDNSEKLYDVLELRKKCPCAVCTDETTGKRNPANDLLPDTIRPKNIQSVGRYALNIEFTDGHKTGIYTFDSLRNVH